MLIMDNKIPWTKLDKDHIWAHVSVKYMEPEGRQYHNMQHIVNMYTYAKELQIPYDVNLDLAILYHDVVYDDKENKEIRSAYMFTQDILQYSGNKLSKILPEKILMPFGVVKPNDVVDYIATTINHSPEKFDTKSYLALLDLYHFSNEKDRQDSAYKLFEEIYNLYPNAKKLDVLQNINKNLARIYGNLIYSLEINKYQGDYIKEWDAVVEGIKTQYKHIETLIQKEKELNKGFTIV